MSLLRLVVISLFMASSYFFAADMYAPSLPAMSTALQVSSAVVQQTVSAFFIALGISQLLCGAITERFGRRPIAMMGAAIFISGSLLCSLTISLPLLIIGRIIQGVGVGALYLLCRTVLQDSLSKQRLISVMSWFGIMFMALPAMTPAIGGFLESHYGWQSSFWFMLALAVIIFMVLLCFLKETHIKKNITATSPTVVVRDYAMIATHRQFLRYLIMMIMANGGVLVFYLIGAFIAVNEYQVTAQDFGSTSLLLIGSGICARLIYVNFLKGKQSEARILMFASCVMLLGALTMLANLQFHSYSLMIAAIAIYCFGAGLTTSVAAVSALYLFPQHKGQTGAVYGSLQMVGIFSLTFIVSHLLSNALTISLVLMVMAFVNICVQQWKLAFTSSLRLSS